MFLQILFIIALVFISSCENRENKNSEIKSAVGIDKEASNIVANLIPYDLTNFEQIMNLPRDLLEISGLGYSGRTAQLVAVNDEKAIIYFLNPVSGNIEDKIDFGTSGDYEGIEMIGTDIFIVKSNGDIYQYNTVSGLSEKKKNTPLGATNDVEGLAYDEDRGLLLLACKGSPSIKNYTAAKKTKSIYGYRLDQKNFLTDPVALLQDEELVNVIEAEYAQADISQKKKNKLKKRISDFSPSAIAVHPITHEWYLLSSVGKMMVIIDRDLKLKKVVPLDNDIHKQPEGICFSPDGTLFISNEGRGLVAKIYSYAYIKSRDGE